MNEVLEPITFVLAYPTVFAIQNVPLVLSVIRTLLLALSANQTESPQWYQLGVLSA
jgi:hypothetical protein